MKLSKHLSILSVALSILLCGNTFADTCYDPNYDTYYNCTSPDEYIAPIAIGILFGAIISNINNNGYYNNEHYHHEHYNNQYNNNQYNHKHYNNGNNYHGNYHGGHH